MLVTVWRVYCNLLLDHLYCDEEYQMYYNGGWLNRDAMPGVWRRHGLRRHSGRQPCYTIYPGKVVTSSSTFNFLIYSRLLNKKVVALWGHWGIKVRNFNFV
jgi:hypothetical protein